MNKNRKSNTICWECRNAVPDGMYGCSWSTELLPVAGWIAEKTKLQSYTNSNTKKTYTSFEVIKCPQFIKDAAK